MSSLGLQVGKVDLLPALSFFQILKSEGCPDGFLNPEALKSNQHFRPVNQLKHSHHSHDLTVLRRIAVSRLLPLLLLMGLHALALPQQQSNLEAKVVELGKSFVDLLSKGDFAAAAKNFDPTMQSALPPERLEEVWKSVILGAGTIQESAHCSNRKAAAIRCRFHYLSIRQECN